MKPFHFQKDIRDRGRQGLKGTLIITVVFGAIDYYLLHQPLQIGHIVGTWFAGLLVLVVALMSIWCLLLLRSKEGWLIEVSDEEILWLCPQNTDEQSFRHPLLEVTKLICIDAATGHANRAYQLVTNQGEKHVLKPTVSGVDMEQFIQALELRNIPVEQQTQ